MCMTHMLQTIKREEEDIPVSIISWSEMVSGKRPNRVYAYICLQIDTTKKEKALMVDNGKEKYYI